MGAHIISILGVASILCLLVAGIILLNLIQRAFARDGIIWGVISIFYPPGTYLFCRKNWELYRAQFIWVTVLLLLSLLCWLIVKLV